MNPRAAPPKKERRLYGTALGKLQLLQTAYHGFDSIHALFVFGRREIIGSAPLTWRKSLRKLASALFLVLGFLIKIFGRPYQWFEQRRERLGVFPGLLLRILDRLIWLIAQRRARLQDWLANEEDGDE